MSDPTDPPATGSPGGALPWKALGAVALLALVLRVVHVLFMRASPHFEEPIMDMLYHVEWARAFAAGERFQEGPFFRAPLYPWFLGACQWVFGPDLLAPRLVQALFGAATAVLAFLVGERFTGDRRVGWVAGVLAATNWVLIYFDGELLIPTLIVPLDLLALYLTLGLAEEPRPRRAAVCGLVWGLSAIARPNVLLFLPFVAAWLAWRARPAWRAALPVVLALTGGVLAPILPLTAYNRLAGDDWVLISSQGGVNFWIGNNPETDGSTAIVPGTRGGWWEGYHDSIALAEAAEGRELRPSEVSRHYADKAWTWMGQEPAAALANFAWKLRLFWLNAELGNNQDVTFFAHHFDPVLRFLPVGFELLAGFGLVGLALSLRRGSRSFPLWGFVPVYTASVVAFFVCSRFRVPVLPVLMVLSGETVVWLLDRARERDVWRVVLVAVPVIAVATLTAIRPAVIRSSTANGRLQLGLAAASAGEHGAAVTHFERALDHDPRSVYAYNGLGRALQESGDLGRAERVLRDGLALVEETEVRTRRRTPGGPEIRATLIDCLVAARDLDAAERDARRFLAADPTNLLVRYGLGRVHAYRSAFVEAQKEFEDILAEDPSLDFVREALRQVEDALR